MNDELKSVDRREFLRLLGRLCLAGSLLSFLGIRMLRGSGRVSCRVSEESGGRPECAACRFRLTCGSASTVMEKQAGT